LKPGAFKLCVDSVEFERHVVNLGLVFKGKAGVAAPNEVGLYKL
jgi:hypothetical protein